MFGNWPFVFWPMYATSAPNTGSPVSSLGKLKVGLF